MLFNNILATAVLAFASVGMASPVPVSGDIASADASPIIAARQRVVPKPSGPVPGTPNAGSAANAVLGIASKVNLLIQQTINKDLEGRRKFTQDVARQTAAAFPGRGVVVCNVGFGTTGTIQSQNTVRYDAKLGTTVTFEVVVLAPGATFTRRGDGGFENWAYSIPGSCSANGGFIDC
ncbi:hypothetical protein F5X68DRAFT_259350 [Plectosphaerella plurivora]|uniref:Uncharacterized protein n=1 Tax=Plectosphaerella plurivora TaxID=936078 RepID=A0A9P8VHI6_9PEZI|nr:hypothetical protein F5X68DRAFT_259350 [Plectosphaerella plurivora]